MPKITTKMCVDYLSKAFPHLSKKWKRLSKRKGVSCDYIRIFENKDTCEQVAIEESGGEITKAEILVTRFRSKIDFHKLAEQFEEDESVIDKVLPEDFCFTFFEDSDDIVVTKHTKKTEDIYLCIYPATNKHNDQSLEWVVVPVLDKAAGFNYSETIEFGEVCEGMFEFDLELEEMKNKLIEFGFVYREKF